jgi:hypothetical protein
MIILTVIVLRNVAKYPLEYMAWLLEDGNIRLFRVFP